MRSFTICLNLWHGLHQRYVINQRAKLFYLCICSYHNSSDLHLQMRIMAFGVICNIFLILPIPSFLFSFFSMHELFVRHFVSWSYLTSYRMWEKDPCGQSYLLMHRGPKRLGFDNHFRSTIFRCYWIWLNLFGIIILWCVSDTVFPHLVITYVFPMVLRFHHSCMSLMSIVLMHVSII